MIVLITGPSGAGKSTVIGSLMEADPRLAFSVSTTTRPRREGEVDGTDYDFVEEAKFDELVATDAFVEWAHVHGHRYGTRRDHLDTMTRQGKIPVLDIDVQGGAQVISKFGEELVSVFLFPPSWKELEERLRGRATDKPEVIEGRLKTARLEVGFADRYTYWVVNGDLEATVGRLRAIISAEEVRASALTAPPLAP